ncbi:hypothetical protein SK803_30060 [Lentzea sp. BCCO 10_0856]|uniref:Uncharacterized protein n=1 Tax=Lentzea miocenica TaxID=3095431 RepID=A0ABU4T8J5_9PSEU|nr:hypothetical protein [Lentzea sp. BCCO 10_0856]MDX8034484.1 hypothetical protein [Lentzea sp. BCCO 10_0856]
MKGFVSAFALIQGEFRGRTWEDVAEWFDELRRGNEGFASHQYMRDVVASVLESGVADRLGVTTSMHDLVVVSMDVTNGFYETIKVISPSSQAPVDEGCFALTFLGRKRRKDGRQEIQQHPVGEAVPAFWRMVEEKFGIKR